MIAHRLSTVLKADQIIVVMNGTISESGTHHELMVKKGAYYSLMVTQMGGYDIMPLDEADDDNINNNSKMDLWWLLLKSLKKFKYWSIIRRGAARNR